MARVRIGDRATSIEAGGGFVRCAFQGADGTDPVLRLDATNYDAEAMRLGVVNAEGQPIPGVAWPPGLYYGEHPILQRPWTCLRGTYEYHCYPGHAADSWDHHRNDLRLGDLLDHLLQKCGR